MACLLVCTLCVCGGVNYIIIQYIILFVLTVLMVMFDPVDYEVLEGEAVDVMLVTNRPYSFKFSVVVACVNALAFGMWVVFQHTVPYSIVLVLLCIGVLLHYRILISYTPLSHNFILAH